MSHHKHNLFECPICNENVPMCNTKWSECCNNGVCKDCDSKWISRRCIICNKINRDQPRPPSPSPPRPVQRVNPPPIDRICTGTYAGGTKACTHKATAVVTTLSTTNNGQNMRFYCKRCYDKQNRERRNRMRGVIRV